MSIPEKDKAILQNLAKEVAEIAALPVQEEKKELWQRLNRLEPVRPMVLLRNGTWHQTADEIQLETEDDFARGQELGLRRTLYHWEHMRDDTVYDANIYSSTVVKQTGMGIGSNPTRPDHEFGAAKYNTVIDDHADPSMIPMPEVTVDLEATERHYQRLSDIYGGILIVT